MARLLRARAWSSRPATSSDCIPWDVSLRAATAGSNAEVDPILGCNYDPFNTFH
jgi:hypothetical protein